MKKISNIHYKMWNIRNIYNKTVIKNDAELKIRVEILKDRLVDLIDNL